MAERKADEWVAIWRGRIRYESEKRRVFNEGEGKGKPPGANFAVKAYRGDDRPDFWPAKDPWIHVAKLKSSIRAVLPSLLYNNPKFRVFPGEVEIDPATGVDISLLRAKGQQIWLNERWGESRGTLHSRIGIMNAFFKLGSVKAGYLCDFEDDEDRGEFATDPVTGELVLDPVTAEPKLARGKILGPGPDGETIRDSDGLPVLNPGRITKEKFFIEVMDPDLCLFDSDSGPDFTQHRYFIEEWVRPLEAVKRDNRFSRAARKRLVATENRNGSRKSRRKSFVRLADSPEQTQAAQKDEEMLRGFDIYDFERGRYLVMPEATSEDNGEFLLDIPMPDGMEHGPTRHLKFTEDVGKEWYQVPDAIDMALVNQNYNLTKTQEFIHRDHSKSRYLIGPGAFADADSVDAEEQMAKFARGEDGVCINAADISQIQPAQKAYLDPSFAGATAGIAMDFNEVAGMPGETRGVADAETATQASILASSADVRNNDRRDNQVATWLCDIAQMLLLSGQANAERDSADMRRIAAQCGGVMPFSDMRQDKFEVSIEIGSTLNKSDPRTNAQIAEFIKTVSQNPWIAQAKGLMGRWLDGMNLDPVLAEELAQLAQQFVAMQNQPKGGSTQTGQVLGNELPTGIGNAVGGSPTGATLN